MKKLNIDAPLLPRNVARNWVLNSLFVMLIGACIDAPQEIEQGLVTGGVDGGTLHYLPQGADSSAAKTYVAPPPTCLEGEAVPSAGELDSAPEMSPASTGGMMPSPSGALTGGIAAATGGTSKALEQGTVTVVATGGEAADHDGGVPEEGAIRVEPEPGTAQPMPGDVLVSEVMANPQALSDAQGEWLELANVSGDSVALGGCSLGEGEPADPTFGPGVTIEHGEFLSVARAVDPGFVPDVVMALGLRNSVDQVQLWCNGTLIDALSYDSATHSLTAGVSLSVSPSFLSAGNNDEPAAFCSGAATYGGGDVGTPGTANPHCPEPQREDAAVPD